MVNRKRVALLATSAVLILVLALGVSAVFAQTDEGDPVPDNETPVPDDSLAMPGFHDHRGMPGQFGQVEGLSSRDELLAEALGIDVKALDAARATAREAAIDQALEEGLITEEQAETLRDGTFGFDSHHGHGCHGFGDSIDQDALLAEALNISVEELEAAKQEANEAALAEMVAAGYLTEAQVDLMNAQRALKDAIDRQALLAEVLGISQAELEEALTNREVMATLIEDSGMTVAEFNEAMQAAYLAAVEQAVQDGVITAEQYQALQNAGVANQLFGGHGFGGGHGRGGHGRPGGFGGSGISNGFGKPSAAPTTTGTSI
jgi:hypothetical protein